MVDPADLRVVLMDSATAATLAQVLPLLLLTLMVEFRRVELHHRGNIALTRVLLGLFFVAFGIVETAFVLSIDGTLIPFSVSDLLAGLAIFGLLALLFFLSFLDTPNPRRPGHEDKP
ncbi:hypothetical protein ACRAWB_15390 [Leifsonia poae]|uniref:hypothetical protein n=1 Tax=Leifsonia poae TaxID=110933 RepID=UPI003D69C8C9